MDEVAGGQCAARHRGCSDVDRKAKVFDIVEAQVARSQRSEAVMERLDRLKAAEEEGRN
jgi:hypothetical protein